MSSKTVQRLKKDGYQTTGIILQCWKHEKAEAIERAKAYKVMGNQVRVVMDTEESHFRDRKEVNRYWVVLVKYTEQYLAFKKKEADERRVANRQSELRRIAKELTLEELAWMMKDKVDKMSVQELLEKKES